MKKIGKIASALYVVKFRKSKEGNLITQYYSDMEEAEKFYEFMRDIAGACDVEFFVM